MSGTSQQRPEASLVAAAVLRHATIDELASIRHLHVSAARQLASGHLAASEVDALAGYLRSEAYTDRLVEAVRNGRLVVADLMGGLAASAGWVAANDAGATARIFAFAVSPLYARLGLGRRVVEAAGSDAVRAGFTTLTVRAPIGSVGLFQRLGYAVSSHGVWPLPPDQAIPVGFLRKVAGKAQT